jgi:DNA-binding NtrC family response regulator
MIHFQSALRRAEPMSALTALAIPSPERLPEPPKTVLVVDDDPMVRELDVAMLGRHGYNVLEAEGTAEALRLADKTPMIHLLITDLSMPELNGLQLTRRFLAVHPNTPVLMVSGSMPLLHARSEQDLDHFDFLPKPFLFDELLQKVRALLDGVTPVPIRRPWRCD